MSNWSEPGERGGEEAPGRAKLARLTPKQREVLRLLIVGLDNRQIAVEMELSYQTIRNYLSIIYGKLETSSRGESICWMYQRGFVDGDW